MITQATSATSTGSGSVAAHELFVLSDEQILEIAPERDVASDERQVASQERSASPTTPASTPTAKPNSVGPQSEASPASSTSHESRATGHDAAEPPPWLAAQMKDPWGGEEAREFWNGVQQARTEAAAYRAAIASPEDARALKELYPGGITEARAAADRARLLDEVDRVYFGGAGNSPEQTSASRVQLAQRMLREDPAAFREMVEVGLKVLQESARPQSDRAKTVASAFSAPAHDRRDEQTSDSSVVAQHVAPQLDNTSASEAHVAAYAAFERAANEDLERTVGGAIERTLEQALPVAQPLLAVRGAAAQAKVPALHARLSAAIRQDIEQALHGDRQLSEQVAQILASRRFDNDSRAQVVRLIGERAQQLIPGAAKRILNEWTQTTLAAHRSRTQRHDAAVTRKEVAPASPEPRRASLPARPNDSKGDTRGQDGSATHARRVDYRKFSDEQILDMS